eukprot:1981646-Amphidinium_carterae.1
MPSRLVSALTGCTATKKSIAQQASRKGLHICCFGEVHHSHGPRECRSFAKNPHGLTQDMLDKMSVTESVPAGKPISSQRASNAVQGTPAGKPIQRASHAVKGTPLPAKDVVPMERPEAKPCNGGSFGGRIFMSL